MGMICVLPPRMQIADKSADFTADKIPYCYVCDVSGASRTATLPAVSGLKGLVLTFKLEVGSGSNTLTIDGASSETIDGATTLVLYVVGDVVTLMCDGDEWHVVEDGLIAHTARMIRSTAQTINNVTTTTILFNSESWDVGGIADPTTNNCFDIRRPGKYHITGGWAVEAGADKQVWVGIDINGSSPTYKWGLQTTAVAVDPYPVEVNDYAVCAAADRIKMFAYHDTGSAKDTETTINYVPRMTVTEVRH